MIGFQYAQDAFSLKMSVRVNIDKASARRKWEINAHAGMLPPFQPHSRARVTGGSIADE
jgi:hypothetical protein